MELAKSPDIVISKGTCEVLPEGLGRIREEAEAAMLEGMETAYKNFPVNREKLRRDTLNKIFNGQDICQALKGAAGATAENHNKLRENFKENGLDAEDAEKIGIIFHEIPIETRCPDDYDWKNSPVYYDVDECEDVIDEIEGKGIPTVLYATKLEAAAASGESNQIKNEPYYKKYAGSGPVLCREYDNYTEAYQQLDPSRFYNPKFVLKGIHGKKRPWSASTLLKECRSADGRVYETENMMFIFSFRTFVQINVNIDGEQMAMTLVLNQVASASTNPFSPLLPKNWIYKALLGGEAARRLLFEALANKWEVTGP